MQATKRELSTNGFDNTRATEYRERTKKPLHVGMVKIVRKGVVVKEIISPEVWKSKLVPVINDIRTSTL